MPSVKKKHQQLYDILLHALSVGTYPQGKKLPKMTELAEQYSVSVNVVTRSVALLKERNLVSIKAGEGIFSNADILKKCTPSKKYSGERVFSALGKMKTLSVLIEDTESWQVSFWNSFFDGFTRKNPDIELNVFFGRKGLSNVEHHDMIIGGNHFINISGYGIDDFIPVAKLELFADGLYDNKILHPHDLAWKNKTCLYPIAFQLPLVLHRGMGYDVTEGLNVIDFIDNLKKTKKLEQVRYKTWSLQNFMVNCGCCCFDSVTGEFKIDNRKKWQTVIDRIKSLYSGGDMLALHGKPLDYNSLFKNELGKGIYYMEYPYNNPDITEKGNIDVSPYPMGDIFPLIPICGCILKKTRFPEEAQRLISGLLEPGVQQEYMNCRIGFPVAVDILEKSRFSYLVKQLSKLKKVQVVPFDQILDDAVETVFIWELYYYFCGRIDGDVLSKVEKKIDYFIKNYRVKEKGSANENT
ncbi:MAG: hypothetical protein A2020_15335 [Lentisphaerae bacterium GWF2_45_14]|nr:MAG: hypothetical protein A2020_15335 [Lentisphaerae bacterium GWF2_45_14]